MGTPSRARAPDRVPFSGTPNFPLLAHWLAFALRLGTNKLTRGLALIGTHCTNTCLGYGTIFGSPGTGPDTLSFRVGVGAMILLLHALKVSSVLDTCYIYPTDICKVNRAHSGWFCAILDPSCRGG